MFTGIVEEIGVVQDARSSELRIKGPIASRGMKNGDSISVNGACLTVTGICEECFSVDIVPETLRRTALGQLTRGSPVNLERSLSVNGRLGGHVVQGHIDGTGRLTQFTKEGDSVLLQFDAPSAIMRYVVEKGFIAVDGTSLTVVHCDRSWFDVAMIPYTRRNTILGRYKVGDKVNLEIDVLAKYVDKLTNNQG